MSISQVKDILNSAITFHKLLVDFYSGINDVSEKASVKLLVDYMARHEQVVKEELSKITADQESSTTNAWLKCAPEYAKLHCFDALKISENSSVDEVIDAGLKMNQCLISLYHQISEVAPLEEVKALFSELEIMEIAEKKKLARMRGM